MGALAAQHAFDGIIPTRSADGPLKALAAPDKEGPRSRAFTDGTRLFAVAHRQ